jgi:predicted transport protein
MNLDSYRRFPQDDEFWNELGIKDVYNLRQRRNYLLNKLENYDRKEIVNIEEYTIEHIMPQNPNLSYEWQEALGSEWRDIQSRYLHTIGNLTLTGYNPELSDRPFYEKRDMKGGFAESPLRLNRGLAKLESWGAKEINDRAQELADMALKIWRYPDLDQEIFEYYQAKIEPDLEEYSLEHFDYLQGEIRVLFEALRTRILNLAASVREEPKAKYIAYKTTTNFVDINPQKSRLRIWINMNFEEVDDPRSICRDVSEVGHYGNGEVEFGIGSYDEIEYGMNLIRQSFEKHTDDILI